MSYFGQFQRFSPHNERVLEYPFSQLPDIAWRARGILKSRTKEQIETIAKHIDFAIDCYFDEIRENEIHRLRSIIKTPKRWKHESSSDYDYAIQFFEWDGKWGAGQNYSVYCCEHRVLVSFFWHLLFSYYQPS